MPWAGDYLLTSASTLTRLCVHDLSRWFVKSAQNRPHGEPYSLPRHTANPHVLSGHLPAQAASVPLLSWEDARHSPQCSVAHAHQPCPVMPLGVSTSSMPPGWLPLPISSCREPPPGDIQSCVCAPSPQVCSALPCPSVNCKPAPYNSGRFFSPEVLGEGRVNDSKVAAVGVDLGKLRS